MQYVAIIVLLPIILGNRKWKIVENGNTTHDYGQVELVFLVQMPQSCLSYYTLLLSYVQDYTS